MKSIAKEMREWAKTYDAKARNAADSNNHTQARDFLVIAEAFSERAEYYLQQRPEPQGDEDAVVRAAYAAKLDRITDEAEEQMGTSAPSTRTYLFARKVLTIIGDDE